MARLKYMINKSHLDPPSRVGLIHNGMSSIYNGRSSISKTLCSKSTHKSIKTQLIEHRFEWKAIIITLIEMSGRKRLIRFKINKEKLLRINYEYFRVILAELLRIARLRSDLCNSYEKNGVVAVKNYLFHITLERMHGCNCSVKKITLHERMDGSS